MRLFTMTITGLVFLGMAGHANGEPVDAAKASRYPSGGEFTNDAGQQNLSYSQSLLEAAQSGDTDHDCHEHDCNVTGSRQGKLTNRRSADSNGWIKNAGLHKSGFNRRSGQPQGVRVLKDQGMGSNGVLWLVFGIDH